MGVPGSIDSAFRRAECLCDDLSAKYAANAALLAAAKETVGPARLQIEQQHKVGDEFLGRKGSAGCHLKPYWDRVWPASTRLHELTRECSGDCRGGVACRPPVMKRKFRYHLRQYRALFRAFQPVR